MEEKISVIIPVYNSERFIAEAIDSVISQSYSNLEILVVDDGSTDNSARIIRSYPQVTYFYQENAGTSAAVNTGLRNVSGKYIAMLDSDDYWAPDKLEKQMRMLAENPELDGVFGYHKRFYNKPKDQLSEEELADSKRLLPGKFKAALLFRKSAFFKVGYFDESIKMGDFLDWYRRAVDLNLKMELLPDVVFYRRIHDDHSSVRNKAEMADYARLLKASLDRRRKSGEI